MRLPAVALLTVGLAGCPTDPTSPMIVSFAARDGTVDPGQTTELSFQVLNALNVKITDSGGSTLHDAAGLSGTVTTSALAADTTFALEATNAVGAVSREVTVMVRRGAPVIDSFTANPAEVAAGETTSLTWSAEADAVDITGGGGSIVSDAAPMGTIVAMPLTTTTYTLVARRGADTAMAVLTVPVRVPPTVASLTAAPNPIGAGATTTIAWTVEDADTVIVTDDQGVEHYRGPNLDGQVMHMPSTTTRYDLAARNGSVESSASVTVIVN